MTTLANPLYAVVGAGDLALAQFNEVVASLRERTEAAGEDAQARFEKAKTRFAELPDEVPAGLEELKGKFTADEVKGQVDAYVALATSVYNGLAERGVEALDRLRTQPLVAENIERAEKVYNDAVDLTEDALGVVSTQTRAVGERAAKLAGTVSGKTVDAAVAVEEAAEDVAERLEEAAVAIEDAGAKVKADADEVADEVAAAKTPAKKAPAKQAPVKKAGPAVK